MTERTAMPSPVVTPDVAYDPFVAPDTVFMGGGTAEDDRGRSVRARAARLPDEAGAP